LPAAVVARPKWEARLLVAEQDHLVGIISLSDLLSFLNLKIELEGSD
jgi:hypothetical protein